MMKKTNEKGITLVTLSVTIIIIFILAIISLISALRFDGILSDSKLSKIENFEKNSREQVDLACSALRVVIAEAHARDNSYSAKENTSLIQKQLVQILNKDKINLQGDFSNGGKMAIDGDVLFDIVYKGEDYNKIYGNKNAILVYKVELGQKSIKVINEDRIILENEDNKNSTNNLKKKRKITPEFIVIIAVLGGVIVMLSSIMMYFDKKAKEKDKLSKANTIKDNARNKVKNACSTIRLPKVKDEDLETFDVPFSIQDELMKKLNENRIILNGEFKIDQDVRSINHLIINIVYIGDDYKEACQDDEAKITYTIGITTDGLKLLKENSTIINNEI